MKILLAIAQLDKRGGKERDCLAGAQHLLARGHEVTIVSTSDDAAVAAPARLITVPRGGMTNHGASRDFAKRVIEQRDALQPDVLMAFERIPGADIYYAADTAVASRLLALKKWLPRGRTLLKLESSLFASPKLRKVFFLTERQRSEYAAHYAVGPSRSVVLPMIIHDERYAAADQAADARHAIRAQLGISQDSVVAVAVAVKPRQKGVDRSLDALNADANLCLVIAGSDDQWILRRAQVLGIESRVRVIPYVANVMEIMAAADVLIHPARVEAAGQVIAEALLAGIPAIVSGICGYGSHVEASGAGIVLPEPFREGDLREAIKNTIERLPEMKRAAAAEAARLQRQQGGWLDVVASTIESLPAIKSGTAL